MADRHEYFDIFFCFCLQSARMIMFFVSNLFFIRRGLLHAETSFVRIILLLILQSFDWLAVLHLELLQAILSTAI